MNWTRQDSLSVSCEIAFVLRRHKILEQRPRTEGPENVLGSPIESVSSWRARVSTDETQSSPTRSRKLLGWEPNHSLHATRPTNVKTMRVDPVGDIEPATR